MVMNRRWERKIEEIRRKNKIWELINRERKKRKRMSEEIEMDEWKEHLVKLMGGVKEKVMKEGRRRG